MAKATKKGKNEISKMPLPEVVKANVPLVPSEIIVDSNLLVRAKEFEEEAVLRLMDEISKVGQLQNIGVTEDEDGNYVLIYGRHRLEACNRLKIDVNCTVYKLPENADYSSDMIHLAIAAIENRTRLANNPADLYKQYTDYKTKFKMKDSEIASIMLCDNAKITRIKKFADVPPEIQQLAAAGKLSIQQIETLSKVPEELKAKQLQWAEANLSSAQIENQLGKLNSKKDGTEEEKEVTRTNIMLSSKQLLRLLLPYYGSDNEMEKIASHIAAVISKEYILKEGEQLFDAVAEPLVDEEETEE